MAKTYLKLAINGEQIAGDSPVVSQGRRDTIECLTFHWSGDVPFDAATGQRTGAPNHSPVQIEKRVDKSTPFLIKAFCDNEPVDSAEFLFFQAEKEGAEEKFLTVKLTGGHISGVTQINEGIVVAGESAPPMVEKVAFVFEEIEWTDEIGGAAHTASWKSADV